MTLLIADVQEKAGEQLLKFRLTQRIGKEGAVKQQAQPKTVSL